MANAMPCNGVQQTARFTNYLPTIDGERIATHTQKITGFTWWVAIVSPSMFPYHYEAYESEADTRRKMFQLCLLKYKQSEKNRFLESGNTEDSASSPKPNLFFSRMLLTLQKEII